MKKLTLIIPAAVLLLASIFFLWPGASVLAADETNDIGFYVRARLPQNQLDDQLTYFDLRVAPGAVQTLEVEVVNETDEAMIIDLSAVSASTNRNGVIDYKTPDIRDVSLKVPFAEIASLENNALTLPARSTQTARITISLPPETFDGVVLGGLSFTRRPAADQAQGAANVQNAYSYVVGVKLSETEAVVTPEFELDKISGELINYQGAFVHGLRNKNAAIAKGVSLSAAVKNAKGEVVAEVKEKTIDMAPNSLMPLALTPLGGTLNPGDYISEITMSHEGRSWSWQESFTIGSVDARSISEASVGQTRTFPLQTLLLVLLTLAAVTIVTLLILLLRRRKAEEKEENYSH